MTFASSCLLEEVISISVPNHCRFHPRGNGSGFKGGAYAALSLLILASCRISCGNQCVHYRFVYVVTMQTFVHLSLSVHLEGLVLAQKLVLICSSDIGLYSTCGNSF